MIVVTGATGNIGRELVPLLVARGEAVRVLVRDLKNARDLPTAAERVVGDFEHVETLDAACEGAKSLFLLTQPAGPVEHVQYALSAAKSAELRRIVFLSSAAPAATAIGRWHREREALVAASGLPYTFLRPGGFMSNALQWRRTIATDGTVRAVGANRASHPIDPADIAAAALAVLVQEGHGGRTYTLAGDEAITPAEQVAVLGRVLGRTLACVDIPPAAALEGMKRGGMRAELAAAVVELITAPEMSFGADPGRTLRALTGRSAHTFETWCRNHAQSFA